MGKQAWSLEDGDNGYWVTRIIDTGAKNEDGEPILRKISTYRKTAAEAGEEVIRSVNVIVKEAQKQEQPAKGK